MKKILALLFTVVLFVGCGGKSQDSNEKKVLKFAAANPENHPLIKGIDEFGRILKEKSEGRLSIEMYAGGQLGDKTTVFQSLQVGAVDFLMIQPSFVMNYGVDELVVLTLPFLMDDVDHARRVMGGEIGRNLLDAIGDKDINVVGIGAYVEGSRNFFFTNKKVTNIEEMKGLKLRVPGGQINIEMAQALGASATPISFGELYSALQSGVVDGAENPISGYHSNGFSEVSKHYTMTEHSLEPNFVLMSERAWNRLSEEEQEIITYAFEESKSYFNEINEVEYDKSMDAILANGVEIVELEDIDKWKKAMEPLYEKFASDHQDVINEIIKARN